MMSNPESDPPVADLETPRIAAVGRPAPPPLLVLTGASAVGIVVLVIVLVLINTVASNLKPSLTSIAVNGTTTPTTPNGATATSVSPTTQPGLPPPTPPSLTPAPSRTPGEALTPTGTATGFPTNTPLPSTALPSPWQSQDVGIQTNPGSASFDANTGKFTVVGSGAGIMNNNDQFHFLTETWSGDAKIVVHVADLSPTNPSTMVGVMIRDGLAPDAIYVGIFVTPQNTVNLQYRTTKGQQTQMGVPISITTPCWVRIERVNNNFTVASSGDGTSWHAFSQVSLNMPPGMLIGVALTSHDANQFATTHVDSLAVSQK